MKLKYFQSLTQNYKVIKFTFKYYTYITWGEITPNLFIAPCSNNPFDGVLKLSLKQADRCCSCKKENFKCATV